MSTVKAMSSDVHRISSVMDELTQKLTLLTFASHQVLEAIQDNDSGHLSEILGPEVLRRMAEQTRLEELYHGSTITSDEAAVASLDVDDLQEIVEQLERNTRELCRKLREVPNVVQELRGLQEVKPVNSMKFIHALADMQEVMLKRLTTPVEDEKANDDLLQMYLQQERAAAERRAELEAQLSQLRTARQKHASRSSEAIAKLKSDLHDIQSTTEQRLWQMNEEFARKDSQQTRAFQRKTGEAAAFKAQLEKRGASQAAAAREDMDVRTRNQRIAKQELENSVKLLDKEIAQNEREIQAMKLRNRMDEESLACLTRALDAIDAEKERKDSAERISRAVYARAEADRAKKAVAACLLQSYWRGINQREEYIALKRAAARKAKRRAKRTK
ncbi:IQ domain-containing protein D, related [Eimeria necatrix]|uniref:Dynein regulatory complex protein 10 n=1 Tax=Eimeria necatrix TaxID=51315 RepID=U6MZV4_9EIME|nr:IQ domain-containing protein D, related [Eimeria necatrix]CDJ69768.1 IQ domain-containing protein D, related [Eimeria necatrix]